MSRIFINPNWHAALIHFPLCLLVVGVGIEWITAISRRPSLRAAGRWILVLGALSAVVVAFSGIYALDDVVVRSQRPEASHASERPWRDLARDARLHGGPEYHTPADAGEDQRRTDEAWRMLERHAWLEGSGTAVILAAVIAAAGLTERARHRWSWSFRVLLLAGLGMMLCGAWFSGETVYRDATAAQLDGSGEPRSVAPAAEGWPGRVGRQMEFFLGPPLQAHVFMAGVTIAMAAGALAMTLRKRRAEASITAQTADEPSTSPAPPRFLPPAAKFWVAAALLALFAGFLGIWNLSRPDEANSWNRPKLWSAITDRADNPDGPVNRRTAHVIVAVCIVAASLALASIARWRAEGKGLLTALSLALLLLVAIQVWLGILLLFDGKGVKSGQPFYRLRPMSESPAVRQ